MNLTIYYYLLPYTQNIKEKVHTSYFIDTKFSIQVLSYDWWIKKMIIVVSLCENLEILSTNHHLKKLVKNSCIHGVIGLGKKIYWEKNSHFSSSVNVYLYNTHTCTTLICLLLLVLLKLRDHASITTIWYNYTWRPMGHQWHKD